MKLLASHLQLKVTSQTLCALLFANLFSGHPCAISGNWWARVLLGHRWEPLSFEEIVELGGVQSRKDVATHTLRVFQNKGKVRTESYVGTHEPGGRRKDGWNEGGREGGSLADTVTCVTLLDQ